MGEGHQKITSQHLRRNAYLYVRQSTLRQVLENTESTKRQYALREKAVALGWPLERVVVIDADLGQSAATADREGFQRLVAEVSMGRAGLVLGLEVSRLARSSADWYRLLEICGLTDTLISDEDGLYDPNQFNDRLLLGLKGTMSEAELHILRARMRGGILSKAKRGELKQRLPAGFVYDQSDRVVLDPDQQVQQALRSLFRIFRRTGSAFKTVRAFNEEALQFPRHLRNGPRDGDVIWAPLTHSATLHVLHNPRYAGAFFYGRTRTSKTPDGRTAFRLLPRDQWHSLVRDAHPGYITWEEYEENLRRLTGNANALGADRRKSPPREGPALLQGLVICGLCGKRMTVRYHTRSGQLVPEYVCQRDLIETAGKGACQVVPGAGLDKAAGDLLTEAMTPMMLEVALAVQGELAEGVSEIDRLRRQQVERARYEADLAQRRYMRVDPENRLVADALEAEWNRKLRELGEAQESYRRQTEADRFALDEGQRAEILALAADFPRLWRDPNTADRDRKRIVRLLIEDVTLIRTDRLTAHVRFKGGATRTLVMPTPLPAWQLRRTDEAVLREIDRLLNDHTDSEVAHVLNERGMRTYEGRLFTGVKVGQLRGRHGLKGHFSRMRAAGMLTLEEVATALGVRAATVKDWNKQGLLKGRPYNDKGQCLFHRPGADAPVKYKHKLPKARASGTTI
jgi:DNA invertase Pin-like site-specific DNA recombinase